MCDKDRGIACVVTYPKGRPEPVEFAKPSEFHRQATLEHKQRMAKDRRYADYVKKLAQETAHWFPDRR